MPPRAQPISSVAGMAARGAHREVDTADDHHQGQPEHDEADLRGLSGEIRKARQREEAGGGDGHDNDDEDEKHDRYRRLHPPLGQDFADHVIRPVQVSDPRQRLGQGAFTRFRTQRNRHDGASVGLSSTRHERLQGRFFKSVSARPATPPERAAWQGFVEVSPR